MTLEQLAAQVAALQAAVDGMTAPPADYYTLLKSGEEVDAILSRAAPGGEIDASLSNKAALWQLVNPNLLDNWYFANPVNQRGQTSYAGTGYTIDRWKSMSLTATTVINPSNITLSDTAGSKIMFQQDFEAYQELVGKTITFSVKATQASNTRIRITDGVSSASTAINGDGIHAVTYTISQEATCVRCLVMTTESGGTCTLECAKLEVGSISTLANDPPPNMATELAKCQRYLQRWRLNNTWQTIPCSGATGTTTASVRVAITLPVQMRTNPSVLFSPNLYVFSLNNGAEVWQKITGVQWTQAYGNTVRIAPTVDTASGVNLPIVGLRARDTVGEYLELSAEL